MGNVHTTSSKQKKPSLLPNKADIPPAFRQNTKDLESQIGIILRSVKIVKGVNKNPNLWHIQTADSIQKKALDRGLSSYNIRVIEIDQGPFTGQLIIDVSQVPHNTTHSEHFNHNQSWSNNLENHAYGVELAKAGTQDKHVLIGKEELVKAAIFAYIRSVDSKATKAENIEGDWRITLSDPSKIKTISLPLLNFDKKYIKSVNLEKGIITIQV